MDLNYFVLLHNISKMKNTKYTFSAHALTSATAQITANPTPKSQVNI